MGEWECTVCGYIQLSEHAPETCPDCGAAKARFAYYAFDENDWAAEEELIALQALAQLDISNESELEAT